MLKFRKFSSRNHITRGMVQDELPAMQQSSRPAMLHRNQGFHQVLQEHQRRPGDAANKAVLESSHRCETASIMILRAAQPNNEATMETRNREIMFPTRRATQAALRHQSARTLTGHSQRVLDGRCAKFFFGTKCTMNKERTIDIFKRSLEIEIWFTKNQITSATCLKDQKFRHDCL